MQISLGNLNRIEQPSDNSLANRLLTDPIGLAKEVSFYPVDGDRLPTGIGENLGDSGFKKLRILKKIVRMQVFLAEARGRRCMKLKPVEGQQAGLPVYYLPWDPSGAAVHLTIPKHDPEFPEDLHPKLFFTSVLSGCTIFFQGSPSNPTIYHCGTEGVEHKTIGDPNDFFGTLLKKSGDLGAFDPSEDVIRDDDYQRPEKRKSKGFGAKVEDKFAESLGGFFPKTSLDKGVKFKKVTCWGTCFGVRAGENWEFYLQQNALITYHDPELYRNKVKRGNQEDSISVPIILRKIFPGGGASAKIESHWQKISVRDK